jgi:hypothetical protein
MASARSRSIWPHWLKTLDEAGTASTFMFRKGEMAAARGAGKIRQRYASGDIIQYEIAIEKGRERNVRSAELDATQE